MNQNYNKVDIYHWFDKLPKNILNKYNNNIIENINYCTTNNMKREALMIESLIQTIVTTPDLHTNKNINVTEIKNNTTTYKNTNIIKTDEIFIVSCQNIIEEYLYLEIIDEVQLFINTECKDIIQKSIFCRELLKYYFTNNEKKVIILKLYENLINKKILFKSNISKGLLLYLETNNINKTDNIENFLKFLKINNITKNIEHIFKKYRIKIDTFPNS